MDRAQQANHKVSTSYAAYDVFAYLNDNEVGDARLFNDKNAGTYVYDHSCSSWHIWTGHTWVEDIRNEAMGKGIESVVEAYANEAMRQAWAATTAEKAGRSDEAKQHQTRQSFLLKRIQKLHEAKRRRNVLTLAVAGTGLVGDEWDRLEMTIACRNGVVKLKR